ncbi:hypothetical protein ASG31_04905 [Chryseobacterium sp. Leaf404]|uniref:DUF4286 family protein n=1 Tax=unclassified Chryseobacterium TaxID=2593645 RepID=UPI000701C9E2|nr:MULTISPECIES: DUF4286 family protein [unclassified Chryseobacterium]KQT18077.1 hypothetical protein ASG31_04905 [Chryseobacterium sp. Leaf404]
MSVLSITFHCPNNNLEEWTKYVDDELFLMTENLLDVNKYILSEVQSDYIEEGKNFNLLLIFDDEGFREDFIKSELQNIADRIEMNFGQDIMIFNTFLDPLKSKF